MNTRPAAETRGIRTGTVLATAGALLALHATAPGLIALGITTLTTGCALWFHHGITTGRWEQ